MPAGLVEQQGGVLAHRNFGEVEVHGLDVAGGLDKRGTLALIGADCAEDLGRSSALVVRRRWTRFAQRRVTVFFWPMRASSAKP
jgi:hypothetical protein